MWEEPFRFLIHDPKYQELDIEVQFCNLTIPHENTVIFTSKNWAFPVKWSIHFSVKLKFISN